MTETATMTPGPQRLRALERANEVRLARAALKRRIADGEVAAAEVIRECPWEAQRWSIGELLMSQRRWGSTRCLKFLRHHQISELKPVGTLTVRQRRLVADALDSFTRCEERERERQAARSSLLEESAEAGLAASSPPLLSGALQLAV